MSFTPRQFRDALGLFPTGVAVITACGEDGRPVGVTVNSFTSVSLDPPLVLVSLARSLRSLEAFRRAPGYAINLLRHDQQHLSSGFARSESDKWQGVDWRPGAGDVPIIEPHLAVFECAPHAQYDGGDHLLLVGRVLRLTAPAEAEAQPLVFFRGQYRAVAG